MDNQLTARSLKETLWQTLQDLISKKIGVREADSIATQSREIIRVINSQERILKLSGKEVSEELLKYANG